MELGKTRRCRAGERLELGHQVGLIAKAVLEGELGPAGAKGLRGMGAQRLKPHHPGEELDAHADVALE
jgi:hypothetical protein